MSCDDYQPALTDVALGAPMPKALEAHVAHCGRCGGFLAADRRLLDSIAAEVQAVSGVAPSIGFEDRARKRVRDGSSRGWRFWLLPGAAAAAVLIVLLRATVNAPPGPPPGTGRAPVQQTPSADVVPPPSAVSRSVPLDGAPGVVRPRRRPAARRAGPEVLIAAEPRAALGRYVESLRRWRVGAAAVLGGDIEAVRSSSIEVAPVELASIDVSAAASKDIDIDPIRIASIDVQPSTMESATKE